MGKPVLIFDFDGTLADSIQVMRQAYNRAAIIYKLKQIKSEDINQLRQMHLRDVLYYLKIPYLKVPFVLFSTLRYYKTMLHRVQLFRDVPDMLHELARLGYRLHIISTNSTENIRCFLQKNHIDFFDEISSCGSLMFGKSYFIKKLLSKCSIPTQQAIYIGDEARDIEAGHEAGVHVIAVSWGYNAPEKLRVYHPDKLVNKPQELISYVQQRS